MDAELSDSEALAAAAAASASALRRRGLMQKYQRRRPMAASTAIPPTTPPATAPTGTLDGELVFPKFLEVPFEGETSERGRIATMFCWEFATHLH